VHPSVLSARYRHLPLRLLYWQHVKLPTLAIDGCITLLWRHLANECQAFMLATDRQTDRKSHRLKPPVWGWV